LQDVFDNFFRNFLGNAVLYSSYKHLIFGFRNF